MAELSELEGVAVLILAIIGYIAVVYALKKSPLWKRLNLSLMGPLLMLRTKRGKTLLKRLARHERFWNFFGSAGVVVCFVMMVTMVISLILTAIVIIMSSDLEPVPPEQVLALPGINPLLPLGYGLLALILAIVVHELSHGVLAMVGKMRVKSMGVLFLVIPVGAFVEPDHRDMEKADRKVRRRVFAAGPMANIVFGLACAGRLVP